MGGVRWCIGGNAGLYRRLGGVRSLGAQVLQSILRGGGGKVGYRG